MRLTLHADYGLRLLIYLATAPTRVVSTAEIGAAYGISKHHLVRVAQSLGEAGFIELSAGRTGGLRLAKPAARIRVGAVVRALETELRLVECFDAERNTCPIASSCSLSGLLRRALAAFLHTLDEQTIADLVRRSGPQLARSFLPVAALTRGRVRADVEAMAPSNVRSAKGVRARSSGRAAARSPRGGAAARPATASKAPTQPRRGDAERARTAER